MGRIILGGNVLSDTATPATAAEVTYDNTDSGLEATDVQAAIDEVAASAGGGGGAGGALGFRLAVATLAHDTPGLTVDVDDLAEGEVLLDAWIELEEYFTGGGALRGSFTAGDTALDGGNSHWLVFDNASGLGLANPGGDIALVLDRTQSLAVMTAGDGGRLVPSTARNACTLSFALARAAITLAADITDSDTVLLLNPGDEIGLPATILIGTERLTLTAFDSNSGEHTATRGAGGTTPAAHTGGDVITFPNGLTPTAGLLSAKAIIATPAA